MRFEPQNDVSPRLQAGSLATVSVSVTAASGASPKLPARQPHAVLDMPSRRLKAEKIERLLKLSARRQPIRLLEIGTGSGGISHFFATHPTLRCEVTAVDVMDQRLVQEGFSFRKIEDTTLPFDSSSFDVVISNHVIEHVGGHVEQMRHLREMRRVMAPDGVGYLAVPNRWMLIEPHFKLWFLSWLPTPLRTPYVRIMRRGTHYDCDPPRETLKNPSLGFFSDGGQKRGFWPPSFSTTYSR